MEAVLKRLLDTEKQAEDLVDAAQAERDRIIADTQSEVRAAAAKLEARLPDLRASLLAKAAERAEQSIAELARRATEQQRDLRHVAESHEQEALSAALGLLADTGKG